MVRLSLSKFVIALGIILVIIFSMNFISSSVREFFYNTFFSFHREGWALGNTVSAVLSPFFEGGGVAKERNTLTEENILLRSELAQARDLKNENEQLRAALGLQLSQEFQLGELIVFGKKMDEDILLARSADALEEGMAVITPEKQAIGVISHVQGSMIEIRLLSHPESSIDVKIPDRGVTAIVKGRGGYEMQLDLIPQEIELQNGDSIVTSNLGGIFPENIFVGSVGDVVGSDVEQYQHANVEYPFPLPSHEFLFVVRQEL